MDVLARHGYYFDNSTARIAGQANVPSGYTAIDNDTGHIFLRITGGWLQIGTAGILNLAAIATAAVQAAATKTGVLAVAKIGNWSVQHDPAAATQATITRAAGAAGVIHVCTSIFASFSAGATAGAATKVYLRDGLTGAGAILWSGSLTAPVGDSRNVPIADLSIVGSAATAMTLEFAAAGALTTLQNVSLTGYDV